MFKTVPRGFEFLSLRHTVRVAEKLGCIPAKIARNRRNSAIPSPKPDDVLAYVAYALPPLSREERAARARVAIGKNFDGKQQAFLDFVLAHGPTSFVIPLGLTDFVVRRATTSRTKGLLSGPVALRITPSSAFFQQRFRAM